MKFVFVNKLDFEVLKKNPRLVEETPVEKSKPLPFIEPEHMVEKESKALVFAKSKFTEKRSDDRKFCKNFMAINYKMSECRRKGTVRNYLYAIRAKKANNQKVKAINAVLSVVDYKYDCLILKINDSERYNAFLIEDRTVENTNGRTVFMYCAEKKEVTYKSIYERLLASNELINAPVADLKYSTVHKPETLGDWLGEQLKQCVG
jgi:hypothetical protein